MNNTLHTPEPIDHTPTPQPSEPSAAPDTDRPPLASEAASASQKSAQPVKWLTPLWASLTAAGIAVLAFGLGAGTATAVTHLANDIRGGSVVSDGRGPDGSPLGESGPGPGGPGGPGGQRVPGSPGPSTHSPDSGAESGKSSDQSEQSSERGENTGLERERGSDDSADAS